MGKNSVHIFGCGCGNRKGRLQISDMDNTILVCSEHHNKDKKLRKALLKNRKPKE